MVGQTIEHIFHTAQQHHQAGRLQQAEILYREILAAHPDSADALHSLGVIEHQSGRFESAVGLIGRAIALRPGWSQAYYNLGLALNAKGDFAQSISAYRSAIALQPDLFQAWNSLGNALKKQNESEEAVRCFKQAVRLCAGFLPAHSNLAAALLEKGELTEAAMAYRAVISLDPRNAETHFRLANILLSCNLLDEAIASYRAEISLQPDFAAAYNNLGNALMDIGQVGEARETYRQAVALDPRNSSFHSALVASMYYVPDSSLQAIDNETRLWNARHAAPLRAEILVFQNSKEVDRRLRIGYVSRDFRNHPVGRFALPLIEKHDREKFEIWCYSDNRLADSVTAKFQNSADCWRETGDLKHCDLANQIREDQIDILVDLAGHTSGNRLPVLARRPAPVQMSYLGFPGTTGLSTVDYRFTDPLADPLGESDPWYSETLVRLPQTNWCFAPMPETPAVVDPPMIRQGHVTFGSFNNLAKVTDQMIATWGRLLQAVPASRLPLKASPFSTPSARQRVQERFNREGVSADRLMLMAFQPDYASHLSVYHQVDIALDTFPYNGVTTTCDALWMGVPVVTLAGASHVSRTGKSLLASVGLTELIAENPDEYVAIAIRLANDPQLLTALNRGLRDRMKASPLMDAPRFARDVETAYRRMWQSWCSEA